MYMHAKSDSAQGAESKSTGVHIRLLGEFAFEFQGQPVAAQAWQRSHARRLLQLICSAPKYTETRQRVLAALWPESDDTRARNRLHHTVHCIRKAWEEIPESARPRINVAGDHVVFVPAENTLVDVQSFLAGVDADSAEAAERLASIEHALGLYRGMLALGWDDCAEIEGRRVWLASLRESTLREALDTAVELDRPAAALQYAHQLALLLETDCDAHCRYAVLLADNHRPDAALMHCQDVRKLLDKGDTRSAELLSRTVNAIQQRANRRQDAPVLAAEGLPAAAEQRGLVSRSCVAAPRQQLLGYDVLVQVCAKCLADPYGSVTTVVGPPGAGKSLLAATVAHRTQAQVKHGALWLDCSAVTDTGSLLAVIAEALDPLCGHVAPEESALRQALRDKELLIVLDGLTVSAASVRLTQTIGMAGRDTRWLVTAWSALHLLGERVVHVEPSQLLLARSADAPSSAAQIVLALCGPSWRVHDSRSIPLIEQICAALDGLPLSLEIAARSLNATSPSELLARLQRDPCALMRESFDGAMAPAAVLAKSVRDWLGNAPPAARRMLSLLSRCRSWVTRSDIECLLGGGADNSSADALIEHCVRHQLLLRRAQAQLADPWSEFRVPRIATAALRLFEDATDPGWCRARIETWLATGHRKAACDASGSTVAASRWFDDHIDDLDGAVTGSLEAGLLSQAATLCAAHAAHWSLSRHAPCIQRWLEGLGTSMETLEARLAAPLLLARARLRIQLGDIHRACDDASRALAQIDIHPDDEVRRQAVQLIDRYSSQGSPVTSRPGSISGRGVEAGESLLRIAQLAVRHGQLPQARLVCAQAVEVFTYFGLAHGLLKAHQYQAKIAFGLGNTELALKCLADFERVANQIVDRRELVRAGLMQTELLLSNMQFSRAIDLASNLMARHDGKVDPTLVARGTHAVAWAHYGQGAYPLAQGLCGVLRNTPSQATSAGLRVNTEILSALIDARSGRPAAALRSACTALELMLHERPISDEQSDLINIAELTAHLQRPDLAAPLMQSLQRFSSRPGHLLRTWVADRVQVLGKHMPQAKLNEPAQRETRVYPEVLANLVASVR